MRHAVARSSADEGVSPSYLRGLSCTGQESRPDPDGPVPERAGFGNLGMIMAGRPKLPDMAPRAAYQA
jgi:hypothetical protein